MVRTEITKLDNGLQLVLCEDKTRHTTFAELTTKFGGLTKDFKVGDKEYHLVDGIAHFLEHLLIDTAEVGNLLEVFNDNYVTFNGFTEKFVTSFYIDLVEDFNKHLETLIRAINICNFTKEDIEDTKKPIIEEIKRSDDRSYRKFRMAYINAIFKNTDYINNLGTVEGLEEVDYDMVKLCHDTFYHPSNQILLIAGNFDIDKVKKLVRKIYKDIDKKRVDFEYIPLNEDKKFEVDKQEVTDTRDDNLYNITFKVDISDFSPRDSWKLSFYLHYFLRYNFDDTSLLFEEFFSNNYSFFSIDSEIMKIEDYLYIDLSCYTTYHDLFFERVQDIISKRGYINEDKFDLLKKRAIVNQILKEESCGKILRTISDNILDHNLYEPDTLGEIELFNADEYRKFMERLDFSNYMITIHRKEDK